MLRTSLPFSRDSAADALSNPDTFGTVLHLIVLSAYGDELYGDPDNGVDPLDPVELYARIKEDFRVELTEEGENKLQAILLAVSTDAYFDDVSAFVAISHTLTNGDLGDLVNGFLEEISVPEFMWGAYEVLLNRDDQPEFSAAVQREIQNIVASESDEEDSAQEGASGSYYQRYVDNQKLELAQQLTDLGLDEAQVSQFVNNSEESKHKEESRQGGTTPEAGRPQYHGA